MLLLLICSFLLHLGGCAWRAAVTDYRDMLIRGEKNTSTWAATSLALRRFMMSSDPDYPIYHFAPPEGWNNDPNGFTFDPNSGLYHRFYQYRRTWSDSCSKANTDGCGIFPRTMNVESISWGHTVSRDLVTWEDWPGINPDTPWDQGGVLSGNCALKDNGTVTCIYSGHQTNPCDVGVCAHTKDWLEWDKTACMNEAPSKASEANHDTAIFRMGQNGSWFVLSGGCTFNGTNNSSLGVPCAGNAQLWKSKNLENFTYVHPLTPGGPFEYWELPYLLPFDVNGNPLRNDQHNRAKISALLFGGKGNKYWIGKYDRKHGFFVPWRNNYSKSLKFLDKFDNDKGGEIVTTIPPPENWPWPKNSDASIYYSFNPHCTDEKGDNGTTRRLMFGWVEQYGFSHAVQAGIVPYWQGSHSLLRLLTVRGSSLAQSVAPEIEELRTNQSPRQHGPLDVLSSGPDLGGMVIEEVHGDAIEVSVDFSLVHSTAQKFGLSFRLGGNNSAVVSVGYDRRTQRVGVGPASNGVCNLPMHFDASILPQPRMRAVQLRVFLDRSIIELYSGGAAVTGRCLLSPEAIAEEAMGVAAWACEGEAHIVELKSWQLRSMWAPVT